MSVIGKLVVAVVGDTSALQKDLKNVQRDLKRTFGKEALDASRALATTMAGVAIGLGALGAAGIKLASDWEQAQNAFTTMLGSADAAKQFLGQLSDFAAATPFELPGLITASEKLLAFKFNAQDIIPMLTSIGDAVAGLGGGAEKIDRVTTAIGQMKAKGKVSAEEMMQLTENGISAWQYLADAIGVSVPEAMDMARKGTISSSTAINAILTGMGNDFGGLMDQQSQTLEGLFSTGKDNISAILREIGFNLVDTFDLKTKLKGAVEWLGDFAKALREGGIREALDKMIPRGVQIAILAIAGAIAGALVPAMISLAASVWAAVAPLAPFMAAGAALGALALIIYKNWDQIREFFAITFQKALAVASIAFSSFKIFILTEALALMKGIELLTGWIPGLGDKVKGVTKSLENMISAEAANIQANRLKFISTEYETTQKKIQKNHTETTQKIVQNTQTQQQAEEQTAQKAKELAEKRASFEKQWSDKLLQETGTRRQILDQEYRDAIAEATKLGADTANIKAWYEDQKTQIAKDEAQKRLDFEAEWNEKLKQAQLDAAGDQFAILENEKQQAIQKATETGASVAAINEYYNLKERQLYQETANQKAAAFVGWLDTITSGQKTFKDALKEMALMFLSTMEQQTLATQWAGIAAATGQAPFTFGASLAWIPQIIAASAPALLAFEGIKALIRGLATGGLVTSPTLAMVGEGQDDEAVLPLNQNVFAQLAEGIVNQLARMAPSQMALAGGGTTANYAYDNRQNQISLNVGVLVADDAGLKKLNRELEKFRISEGQRRGE